MPHLDPILAPLVTAFISSVVSAIVGAVVAKMRTMKQVSEQAKSDAEVTNKLIRENMKMTCRLTIYDSHFSVDEKLEAYVIYRDECHGNHQTKSYMDNLVGMDVDEYLSKHQV